MRRVLTPLLVLAGAAVVGVVAGVVLLGRDGGERRLTAEELALTRARVQLSAELEPRAHLFGERVTARLEALFDPRRVRPDSVRTEPTFTPYRVVSETREESAAGDLTRLRFTYVLECLRRGCTPSDEKREFEPGLTSVFFTVVGVGASQETVQWPPLEVVSRLGPFDLERAEWRADTRSLPEPTFRASPAVLAGGLFGGAALLVLAAAALVVVSRPRRVAAEEEVDGTVQRRSALERALEQAEAHSRNGTTPEGRKALERLARELLSLGHADLAGRARGLAWAPRAGGNGEVSALGRDVRERTAAEEEAS